MLDWSVSESTQATPNPSVVYAQDFPIPYDSQAAASQTLGQTFPAGQTSLFQGLWTDPVTGLAYARNRWLDSRNASWLSEDPAGPVDSPNLYAGFGLDPVNNTDPMGTCPWADWECWGWVAGDFGLNTGHDLWNVASLGTLERVERQKNLGTLAGVGESMFQGARSISNAASFGVQEAIYETQMKEGPGLKSVGMGISKAAYDLTPMEEVRVLVQEGDQLDTADKIRVTLTGISKTAALVAGAKAAGESGAAAYYRSRATAVYRRALADYEGRPAAEAGKLADRATKTWLRQNLKDFEQVFDPQTRRVVPGSNEAAQPDILLPQYRVGFELKSTFDAAWKAHSQFDKFVDLFPEYNINYILGNGGWVSPSGVPFGARALQQGAAATILLQGGRH
jgi:RHS repeat-associated protein